MAVSTRFSIAVHTLALLAQDKNRSFSSAQIATSVNTNPAFIRRILSQLSDTGMTASTMGKTGGTRIAKKPKNISLYDIYRAVEEDFPLITIHEGATHEVCPVSNAVIPTLENIAIDAESALERQLMNLTLKDVRKGMATINTPVSIPD